MEPNKTSLKELKKRKMLLILPLLTLPFITILFWTLGGGKMDSANLINSEKVGFNINLPIPKFKEDTEFDKMSYYDQATTDSLKRKEQIKNDPNYRSDEFLEDTSILDGSNEKLLKYSKGKINLNSMSYKDRNEQKIHERLQALQKAISEPSPALHEEYDMRQFENYESSNSQSADLKKIEEMMSTMSAPEEPDPELKQLGGMLENILDIQHPARVQERLKEFSQNQKRKIFTVDRKVKQLNITTLQTTSSTPHNLNTEKPQNSFFSLDRNLIAEQAQNTLEAVIDQTQTIVNGSTIKFRLSNDVFINGVLIPKNSFLFGIAALKGERLQIKIENITYQNSIFPVELSVYDMDGIEGIYIPGAINRDVAKASADRSIQTLGVASLDDSWGAQAAGMGLEAAKSLMSKKVKLIKVVVKAGYRVLLYDEKQKDLK